MIAIQAQLLNLIQNSRQFVIPIYQRSYSWTEIECRQLWDDILRTGSDNAISAHFVGSIVYVQEGPSQITNQSPLLVIDGQQRLTTVMLLIAALAKALDKLDEGKQEPVEGFSPPKLRGYYLLNSLEKGGRRYKLVLSQTDKDSLMAIADDFELPKERSLRVADNFQTFESWIEEQKGVLVPICLGLSKLMVVDVALTRGQDNPQLIFESMNSTGRELTQADLIRNFILMGLEPEHQTKLYAAHWRPIEVEFGQEAYGDHFDGFMRHYLTVKTGEIPNVREVYEAFKRYSRKPKVAAAGVDALVADIRTYAGHYCAMALGQETDKSLALAFHDLRELKVDVAYPFLLELYRDYKEGVLTNDELLQAVRLVESYVFRRAVCAIPTNSLNKTFATFVRELKKDKYLESIQAHLQSLPSYRRFPNDEEFRRELKVRDLYHFRNRSYWLRRLENHNREERVSVDEYTIEHILPQNENLRKEWQDALGPDWRRVQQIWLHTLGNLTLTGYNEKYSDLPFIEKRDMQWGFKDSPLQLNKGLAKLEVWNKATIEARADELAGVAVQVWKAPTLPPAVLATYRPAFAKGETYSIADHPHLSDGLVRELFEAFRTEVLALDPCVSEEFLKVYIAYKAETNFVDVVPQTKRLRLSLNIGFHEIQDPQGKCKDVSGIGRWGNGDVEVGLNTPAELPYVIGLVRQAYEKQMGGAGSES